ncbi:MAG: hypothetical protein ACP5O4_07105 [bacterium]|jgi:hypothetical protein
MIILFPSFINNFFSLLEFPLFYQFFNKDYVNLFNIYFDIYLNNINNFYDSIYEDYKFLKTTLDLDYLKNINEIYYNFILKLDELISNKLLDNIFNRINQNSNLIKDLISNLNLNEFNEKFDIIYKDLESNAKLVLQDIVKLIDFSNNINKILNVQKKLSPFPFVDKFLKMFLVYIQNINDLSNYPIDTLLNLMLKNVSFINTLETNYYHVVNILEEYLKTAIFSSNTNENLNKLINYYKDLLNFIEALKYAIGGVYQIASGNIEQLDKKEVELLFIQINQASNGLFQKQIEINNFINSNFETPFDLYLLIFKSILNSNKENQEKILEIIFNEFNNFIISFFSNPLVYYLFKDNPENIYEKLIFYLDNYLFIDLKKIDKNEINKIIEIIEYYKNQYFKKEFFDPNLKNILKNIYEIVLIYNLFINHNITYTTFFNTFKNIFSFINLYKIFSLNDNNSFESINLLENRFNDLYNLINPEDIFYKFYVNFYNSKIDYYRFIFELSYLIYEIIYLLKDLLISFNSIINTKFKCPKCFVDNEYLNLRCSNCGFVFPFNPTKVLLNNIINSNPLVWGYTLNLIDLIFYKKDKESALDLLYNSIDNFSNFLSNIDPLNINDEKIKDNYLLIQEITGILRDLYDTIENELDDLNNLQSYQDEIISKISKIIDISKSLKLE